MLRHIVLIMLKALSSQPCAAGSNGHLGPLAGEEEVDTSAVGREVRALGRELVHRPLPEEPLRGTAGGKEKKRCGD